MKKILLLFILFFQLQFVFSQTDCDITKHYDKFLKIEKYEYRGERQGETYLNYTVLDSLETPKCYGKLLANSMYINYLISNFASILEIFEELHEMKDTESIENIQKVFINRLENDANFNTVMMELVDKTVNNKIPKDTITVQFLMNIASKYFKVIDVDFDNQFFKEENQFLIKHCIGIHGIEDTELNRSPFVEAFAWAYTSYKFRSPEIIEIRKKMREDLHSINLGVGINNAEGILRAQGALYYIMSKNEKYRSFLLAEYEANKDILPFVIVD